MEMEMNSLQGKNENPPSANNRNSDHHLVKQLMKAVHGTNLVRVKELLNTSGVGVNCLCLKSGDSAMHMAAMTDGGSTILKYLIEECKANMELTNADGKTSLHFAAHCNQLNSARVLLEHGANVNALKRADWTPLMLACTKENTLEVIQFLFTYNADMFFSNLDGWNCFHIACRAGNEEIVRFLISQVTRITSNNELDTIKFLFAKSKNGRTPLHTAGKPLTTSYSKSFFTGNYLMNRYIYTSEVMHDRWHIVNLLFKSAEAAGIDISNETDKCGSTPLMEACRFSRIPLVDLLCEKETHTAALDKTNLNGMNCLHIASEAGEYYMINHLINRYKVNVNSVNEMNGMSSLHYAVRENHTRAIMSLLEHGADPTICDKKGWTCLDMSLHLKKSQAYEVLQLFEQSGKAQQSTRIRSILNVGSAGLS